LKSIATYLIGYLVAHILLVRMFQAFFCTDIKMIELGLIVLVFGVAVVNSKKIILEKADFIIIFLLVFLNIYFTFIEQRGLIFFKMTYVLSLAILLSKVILPNISLKRYLRKIDIIYFIVLIGLVIEYLILLVFGDAVLKYLFMCNGEISGVRGYIPFHNMTKDILPYHITGLNSIMMGTQTGSELAVIIFMWYFYKFKDSEKRKHLALGLLAVLMLILSPTITAIMLLFISIVLIYLIDLGGTLKEKIRNFYKAYVVLFIAIIFIYIAVELLTYRYQSLDYIYEEYFANIVFPYGSLSLKEILFGISHERALMNTITGGEIAFLNQFLTYGFVGIGVFYISIFYYIIRALKYEKIMSLTPNILVLVIFILGNIHYQVMFNYGVLELFALHLAYIIYSGSYKKNN
jgi:hypothetical protein